MSSNKSTLKELSRHLGRDVRLEELRQLKNELNIEIGSRSKLFTNSDIIYLIHREVDMEGQKKVRLALNLLNDISDQIEW